MYNDITIYCNVVNHTYNVCTADRILVKVILTGYESTIQNRTAKKARKPRPTPNSVAQLIKHCTRIVEVMGSNPIEASECFLSF